MLLGRTKSLYKSDLFFISFSLQNKNRLFLLINIHVNFALGFTYSQGKSPYIYVTVLLQNGRFFVLSANRLGLRILVAQESVGFLILLYFRESSDGRIKPVIGIVIVNL